ncbi:Uncharacterised protein [Shigella sonnei]|nr:Uncharacterised protein [Shigella sonnei]SJJ97250.1 Uncharacterised protein [Shigella sonnei]SJK23708.1 Uncharacterised protein [Shigella sonnei]
MGWQKCSGIKRSYLCKSSSIFFILRVNAGCVILSNLAALLNELDSASMTNAFILDNSCFIITPENGSDDFGWLAVKNFNCI